MIRVLHVVTSMNVGGIETFLMNLYRNIDKRKVQFDFLVHRSEEGFFDNEIKKSGGKIYYAPKINPFRQREYEEYLVSFFKNASYQTVHSHINAQSMTILKCAEKANVPIRISHSHSSKTPIDYKFIFKTYNKLKLGNYTTNQLACSDAAGNHLYGKNSDYKVINNAIDAEKYVGNESIRRKKREELSVNNQFVVGHIGNFSKAKNYPFILEVFKALLKKKKNAVLVLIGNNDNNSGVEQKVKDMDLEDYVIFTGLRSDIPELLQAMDVFLFPSLYEGLPVALIEAQASGLLSVVSNAITKEVAITDNVEFISLNQSADYWADQLLKLSSKFERKNEYRQIKDAGYDIKENVQKLQEFYLSNY